MTRRQAVIRWLADWRTGATLAATVLMALVVMLVVDSTLSRDTALDALRGQRAAATRRIDLLQAQLARLQAEQSRLDQANGRQAEAIAALTEQLRRMGAAPIVAPPQRAAEPAPAPAAQRTAPRPSPARTASPRPTPRRSPSPSPSPTCLLGLICR